MAENSYNGYRNFETWLFALHVSCERSSQEYWFERARYWLQYYKDYPTKYPAFNEAEYRLAREIEEDLEEMVFDIIPDGSYGFANDLMTHAVQKIDADEIAELWLESVQEDMNL